MKDGELVGRHQTRENPTTEIREQVSSGASQGLLREQ